MNLKGIHKLRGGGGLLDHPLVGLKETNFSNGFLKGINGFGPVGMDEVGL